MTQVIYSQAIDSWVTLQWIEFWCETATTFVIYGLIALLLYKLFWGD